MDRRARSAGGTPAIGMIEPSPRRAERRQVQPAERLGEVAERVGAGVAVLGGVGQRADADRRRGRRRTRGSRARRVDLQRLDERPEDRAVDAARSRASPRRRRRRSRRPSRRRGSSAPGARGPATRSSPTSCDRRARRRPRTRSDRWSAEASRRAPCTACCSAPSAGVERDVVARQRLGARVAPDRDRRAARARRSRPAAPCRASKLQSAGASKRTPACGERALRRGPRRSNGRDASGTSMRSAPQPAAQRRGEGSGQGGGAARPAMVSGRSRLSDRRRRAGARRSRRP